MSAVGFDLHAATAPKALLAAPEFAVNEFLVNLQTSRQAGKKGYEGFAMRFSGSEITQHVEEAL
jgi:hypothetical protein